MKRTISLLALMLLATMIAFNGCHKVRIPAVTTAPVRDVGATACTAGGEVTADGGGEVVERGVCWGVEAAPERGGDHVSVGKGLGNFSCGIAGLAPSTTYYVRAYAVNDAGTAYGEPVAFTTLSSGNGSGGDDDDGDGTPADLPQVTTARVTNVMYDAATGGGEVIDDGGANILERGLCWGLGHDPDLAGSHVAAANTEHSTFVCGITGLTPHTTYYVRAYAMNEKGVAYGSEVCFETGEESPMVSIDSLEGLFSVSGTQQVRFSRGNLQFRKRGKEWRFAENQWDYVGEENANVGSSNYAGWIDLFGWGTSGYHDQKDPHNIFYRPWDCYNSTEEEPLPYGDNNYGFGPSTGMESPDLTGSSANYDWGVYNSISNGGDAPNLWRTLTCDEWSYVFVTRTTPSGQRFAKANVNGVNGVILLPDEWSADCYELNHVNLAETGFEDNPVSASQWNLMEQHGAVFLPAAGLRYTGVSNGGWSVLLVNGFGDFGNYWSVTHHSAGCSWGLHFGEGFCGAGNYGRRFYGQSVRLVKDVR